MKLKLTYSETQKLDEDGAVYALRDKVVYLVEKIGNKDMVTIISATVVVEKTYQIELADTL